MRHPTAEALRKIAEDLRAAGDLPLVYLTEHGVTPCKITLADEIWLIAFELDGYDFSENSAHGQDVDHRTG
jgi:hypothetical protein